MNERSAARMSGKTINTDEMEQQEQNVRHVHARGVTGPGVSRGRWASATGESGEGEGRKSSRMTAAQDVGYRGEFKPELVQQLLSQAPAGAGWQDQKP